MSEVTTVRRLEPARRRRFPWWAWVLTAVVAIVAVVAVFGGFGTVPVQRVMLVQPGDTVAGAEVDVTVNRIYLSDRMPGVTEPAEGEAVLIVEAELLNRIDVPTSLIQDRLRIIAGDALALGDDPDRVVDLRNANPPDFLQPGLPIDVAFAWPVDADALSVGEEVIVGVLDRVPVSDDPIYGDTSYSPPRALARLVVDLEEG